MTFAGVFAIVVGMAMIGQWAVSIKKGQVAGPEAGYVTGRGRIEMLFHYVAEFGTAIVLLISGISMLFGSDWGVKLYLVSAGMLLYTVVNSPGYFAQKREWPMVGMFAVILVLALVSVILVI